jgi:hypothetical protein
MLSRDLDLDVSLLWNFFGYALRARPLVGGLDQATAEADLGPFSPGCINRPSTAITLCATALRSSKASSMHDFMSSTFKGLKGTNVGRAVARFGVW